ncbi:MAG: hypothetical protein AAF830_13735 [Pseudomonadota bacterium]
MRAFSIKLHRILALLGGLAILIWGLSGLLHPIMVTWGPQQAVFFPPSTPLDLSEARPFGEVFEEAGLQEARAVKVIASDGRSLLQVTAAPMEPRRYFDLLTGGEIEGQDRTQAEFLARYYTQASEPLRSVEFITEFTDNYPSVNRLLPVYRVAFERQDDLAIYVYTETNASAGVSNRFKDIVQTGFRWFHSWSWFPREADWARTVLILMLVGSAFAMTLSGIAMLVLIRRKARAPGIRGWHRIAGYGLAVPALFFTSSGLFHLLQYSVDPPVPALRLSEPLDLTSGTYDLTADWKAVSEGMPIGSVSIIEDQAGRVLYRLGLQASRSGGPVTPKEIRNARFDGVEVTGPAVYLDAATGEVLDEGDRGLALELAGRFTGAGPEAVEGMKLVTRFGAAYDFRNKRLPVWQVDYGAPVHATVFVDTTTGVLADQTLDRQKAERLSFSMLHKWNFLHPLGRDGQNLATALGALSLVVAIGGLGLVLDLQRRKRRKAGQVQ